MVYIDTSSFFKVLVVEEYSAEVNACISNVARVAFSEITRLEIEVQVRGFGMSGKMSRSKADKLRTRAAAVLEMRPFESTLVSTKVFATALSQHQRSGVHCRSLGRLHLAAMEELGIRRLMTHDVRQAEAAREMGIEVLMPGVE